MTGEDTHFMAQIHDRLAKLWPTTGTLTDLYGGVGKLWPTAEQFTELYQGLQRRSERVVSEWVTLAKQKGNAAFVPQFYDWIAKVRRLNGEGRGTAGPHRKGAGGQQGSYHTTPE